MLNRLIVIWIIAITLSMALPPGLHADPAAEQAALSAAKSWLNLVDQGRYSDSWDQSASSFRQIVGKDHWVKSLQAVRKPLGKVISRKVGSKQYTQSLPGAPDGQYVVIHYRTVFEFKKISTETITPMLDEDGQWRVSGYYIR